MMYSFTLGMKWDQCRGLECGFRFRCIWDIRNQKMISSLKSPRGSGAILDCAYFRENGKMVAGTSDGSLCQWTCP